MANVTIVWARSFKGRGFESSEQTSLQKERVQGLFIWIWEAAEVPTLWWWRWGEADSQLRVTVSSVSSSGGAELLPPQAFTIWTARTRSRFGSAGRGTSCLPWEAGRDRESQHVSQENLRLNTTRKTGVCQSMWRKNSAERELKSLFISVELPEEGTWISSDKKTCVLDLNFIVGLTSRHWTVDGNLFSESWRNSGLPHYIKMCFTHL